ncbi:MAG: tandem-95 repeat protein, partial [Hyphomicrobiaceae bacterium]
VNINQVTIPSGGFEHTESTNAGLTFKYVKEVVGGNRPPFATGGSLGFDQDSAAADNGFRLFGGDDDGNLDHFELVDLSNLNGTLSRNSDGTGVLSAGDTIALASGFSTQSDMIYFKPNGGYLGSASFTFKAVDDLDAESADATVAITVVEPNTPPVAVDDPDYFTPENTPLVITDAAKGVLANDTDADAGDDLRAILVNNVRHGTLALDMNDGTFIYTPFTDFVGDDTFTYRANDGKDVSNVATVTITVNVAPSALNTLAVTNEDSGLLNLAVTATDRNGNDTIDSFNFTDLSGLDLGGGRVKGVLYRNSDGTDPITPTDNIVEWNGVSTPVYFRSSDDFNGDVRVYFVAIDQEGAESNTAEFRVTVQAVNDAPVANDVNVGVDEDSMAADNGFQLSGSDVDANLDHFEIAELTDLHGTLYRNSEGTVALSVGDTIALAGGSRTDSETIYFEPNAGYLGSASFTYKAVDGLGAKSAEATVTITVNAVNDAPVFETTALDNATEDEDYTFNVTASDVDDDDADLTITLVAGPAWLSLSSNGGNTETLSGTPSNDDVGGPFDVSLKVEDDGGASTETTFTITVIAVNDAPVFETTALDNATEDEDYTFNVTASDVDDDDADLTITLVAGPAWLSLSSNGGATETLSGTPLNDDVGGPFDVKLKVEDDGGASTETIFKITVGNTNDAPVITSDGGGDTADVPVDEGATAVTTVAAEDIDVGDALAFSIVDTGDSDRFEIDADSGVLIFKTAPDFEDPTDDNGDNVYEVTVKVEDGNGGEDTQLIRVTVGDVDEIPPTVVITAPDEARGPFAATVTFSEDVDGFDRTELVVGNGDITGFSGEGAVYTFEITPRDHGPVTLDVAAGAAHDKADNPSLAAAQVTVNYIDESFVRTRTQRVIKNFMSRRAKVITASEPDLVKRLRGGGGGGSAGSASFTGTPDNAKLAFALGLRQAVNAHDRQKALRRAEPADIMALGAAGNAGLSGVETGFDLWARGEWSRIEQDSATADIGLLYVGADYRFSGDLVVGLLAQFDWTDETDDSESIEASGSGWMVGPYIAARLHQNLVFDARAAWGQSDNEVSPFATYSDDFDGERWLVKAQFTGDFNFGDIHVAPHVAVIYFEEEQDAYVDSLDITIPGQTVSLGRLTFGPKISSVVAFSDGTRVSPYVAIKGVWDFESADIVNLETGLAAGSDDFRARVDSGLVVRLPGGIAITGAGHYDGLGADDYEAYGGHLEVRVPLQEE